MPDKRKKSAKNSFTQHHFERSLQSGAGFTLIEIIFALAIISSVTVAIFSLIQRTTAFLPGAGNRLIASYLAQEGVEIVRNLRDNNRFAQPPISWDYGLTGCAAGCEADFDSQALIPWAGRYFKNGSGLYNYDTGEATRFQRRITITAGGSDILIVSVQVSWEDKGVVRALSAVEKLYHW
ncbi:MAG: prepilin-type N-terminal cleavage/methylation domain-containing protein [bacterium]|nr:prepilin-type N-terminal cleavage/methylation domain-containing protein [bacterium]